METGYEIKLEKSTENHESNFRKKDDFAFSIILQIT